MFGRILIVAWGALFAGTAALFLFPKGVVRILSPTILLIFSVVVILGSVIYGLVVTYHRIANRSGSG
jgi:hypothetical protein